MYPTTYFHNHWSEQALYSWILDKTCPACTQETKPAEDPQGQAPEEQMKNSGGELK